MFRLLRVASLAFLAALPAAGATARPQESRPTTRPASLPVSRPTTRPVSRPVDLTPDEAARANAAIARLESDDYQVRDEACAVLIALGGAVRPFVIAAIERAGLETKLRLSEVLSRLPESVETVDALGSRTLVTLDLERTPFRAALKAITAQTGIAFPEPLNVEPETAVTIKVKDEPFFQAIDALGRSVGARWQQDYAQPGIRWYAGTVGRPLCRYVGPIRIALNSFNRSSNMTFGGDPSEQCYIHGQLDVEPTVAVLGTWLPPIIEEITEDGGRSLVIESQKQQPYFNVSNGRGIFNFSLPFLPPSAEAKTLKRLAAKIRLVLPKTYQTLSLPIDFAKPEAETIGRGVAARVLSASNLNGRISASIEIERPPLVLDENRPQQVQDSTFEWILRSGDLRAAPPPGRSFADGRETLTLVAPAGVAAEDIAGIRIRILLEFEKREVEFAFEDIPLP